MLQAPAYATRLLRVHFGSFGIFSRSVEVNRYICPDCGLVESRIDPEDLPTIRERLQ